MAVGHLPKSVAAIGALNEDRIRKVAADNPDLLHCRLARRFGISVGRLRKILGVSGAAELLRPKDLAKAHYTPRPGESFDGRHHWIARARKKAHVRKKLRAQEDTLRAGWNPDFKPMRRPNGRGGPMDLPVLDTHAARRGRGG